MINSLFDLIYYVPVNIFFMKNNIHTRVLLNLLNLLLSPGALFHNVLSHTKSVWDVRTG